MPRPPLTPHRDADLPPVPPKRDPHPGLSREELARRLTVAEGTIAALTVRRSVAEYRLDVLRQAFAVLQELAEEKEQP